MFCVGGVFPFAAREWRRLIPTECADIEDDQWRQQVLNFKRRRGSTGSVEECPRAGGHTIRLFAFPNAGGVLMALFEGSRGCGWITCDGVRWFSRPGQFCCAK